ncbi:ABC transporter permease [Xanthobacter pseudotagetidis]|uniref:ABC transporter permease n=1 Tax=Xanthobacter pseudotagetidis TaxID=3119911 RepID=UPI003728887F
MSIRIYVYRLLVLAGTLGLWQGLTSSGLANPFWTSSPALIAERTWKLVLDGEIFYHFGITINEAFSGLVAGTIAGVILGLATSVNRTFGMVFEPFIIALNSLPRVALGPLLVMYVGIGFASKFLLAFSLVVVVVMLSTFEGVRSVDPTLISALRTLQASKRQLFTKLLLPNSIPWILSAVRVSIPFAIIGAIVGEFISAQAGIGFMIDEASGAFDTTGMLTPLLWLMVFAFTLDRAVLALSTHLMRWRPVAL